jgi:hypothetical protein
MGSNQESKVAHIMAIYTDGFAEVAVVENERMLAFKPVSNSFFESLSQEAEFGLSGIIHSDLIGYRTLPGSYIIVFRTKACKKNISFNSKAKTVSFPDMIWVYKSSGMGDLSIYKETEKQLYTITMSNVTSSKVCIGNCPRPTSKRFIKVIEEIKEMFFDGVFTHSSTKLSYSKCLTNKETLIQNFLAI